MKQFDRIRRVAGLAWCGLAMAFSSQAGLFKLDFGAIENDRVPVDGSGEPIGLPPAPLTDWDVFPTWVFAAFPDNVARWPLRDVGGARPSTNGWRPRCWAAREGDGAA